MIKLEEQKLVALRQIAQAEEDRVRELKKELDDANNFHKEIGDKFEKLMEQRRELIEKVDKMK